MSVKMMNQKQHKIERANRFLHRWKRQISYAWRNVYNDFLIHKFASTLTILVIAISVTLPVIGYLIWKNANEAANQWQPSPNLTVYLDKTLNDNSTSAILETFRALPGVASVAYLSREAAKQEFKEWSGFSKAIDLLDENPLPAVAIIIPKDNYKDNDSLHNLQIALSKIKGIDDVKLDNSWFVRLIALADMIQTLVLVVAIFMILAVSLVIGNSVRLTIFSRRDTILVMELIGATEGFILRPFLYNGLSIGFLSALLALLLSEMFIYIIDSVVLNVSSVFGTIFTMKGLSIDESLLIILITMSTGWLSAFIATKKYFKITNII